MSFVAPLPSISCTIETFLTSSSLNTWCLEFSGFNLHRSLERNCKEEHVKGGCRASLWGVGGVGNHPGHHCQGVPHTQTCPALPHCSCQAGTIGGTSMATNPGGWAVGLTVPSCAWCWLELTGQGSRIKSPWIVAVVASSSRQQDGPGGGLWGLSQGQSSGA